MTLSNIIYIIWQILLFGVFLAFALGSKDRHRKITYYFWSAAFAVAPFYEVIETLGTNYHLSAVFTEGLLTVVWVLFLVLLYLGTLYIFVHKFHLTLTYLLLIPVVIIPLLAFLFPTHLSLWTVALIALAILPLEIVLGLFSWFLGLSVWKDAWALTAYWLMGGGWLLLCTEMVLVAYFTIFNAISPTEAIGFQGIEYLGHIGTYLILFAFLILIGRRLFREKECF